MAPVFCFSNKAALRSKALSSLTGVVRKAAPVWENEAFYFMKVRQKEKLKIFIKFNNNLNEEESNNVWYRLFDILFIPNVSGDKDLITNNKIYEEKG